MTRCCTALLVPALLLLSSAFGNEVEHIAAPMAHLVLNDQLYTTIHTNVQGFKGGPFTGKVEGKFEKMGGGGWYTGNFRGAKSGNKGKATFDFKVGGARKSKHFDVKMGGKINGKVSVHGKRVSVYAGYVASARGTVRGKIVKGSCKGNAVFTAANKKFLYRERGTARVFIGGKLITAKYLATLNKNTVKVAVVGMYAGKKFFVKYSFSLSLLPLGLDMNPMMIKRNYGTVYVTAGGKTYTKKFDVKGMEMPKLM